MCEWVNFYILFFVFVVSFHCFKFHLATSEKVKSDWTIIPDSWKLLSNQIPGHISPLSPLNLSKTESLTSLLFIKDALDRPLHHLHPHLFAKCSFCCEKGHFYPVCSFSLCLVLFLYVVHDSSIVLMKKMRKKLEQTVKKRQKDQLKAATYEWLL